MYTHIIIIIIIIIITFLFQEREPSEDEMNNGTSFISDEDILEFKSRDDIKQKREELREMLLKKFNDLCKKKCCVLPKSNLVDSTSKGVNT